jgi:hypothetical protein
MRGSIRRFWRQSLGDSFSRNLPLVKDSRDAWNQGSQGQPPPTTARKPDAPLGVEPGSLVAMSCLTRCFPTGPRSARPTQPRLISGSLPAEAASWSTSQPAMTSRSPIPCSTMTIKSAPARRTPRRIPSKIGPTPSARPTASRSSSADHLYVSQAAYGTATASEAWSPESATHSRLRCSPRIAPVTFKTLPDGQDKSCT